MLKKFTITLFFITSLLLVSCGSEEPTPTPVPPTPEPTATATEEPTPTPEPTNTPTPEPSPTPTNEILSLDEVQQAVIRIESQGTFVDPDEGFLANAAGSGSGFIISEDGIAVTNNHVVTGAALIKVYVAGETEPRNAKILGVAECSDLAVIDIDGDGFRYLNWLEGDANVGLDVYTAGFPLGDPEFTLTRGIVSKANADGESSWASVDNVLEHDATINPGNSGGPLVTADGKVVGINYAGNSSTSQYFAIALEEALPVIEQLREGEDVFSIGINGQAIANDEASGIWVASVASGSPASDAGIQPGDILYSMEGLFLAADGTMADYCDILRSHDADDTLSVEVYRFETDEFLKGELNGKELTVDVVDIPEPEVESGIDYTYISVTDDSERLVVELPEQWSDINGSEWLVDGESVGYAIRASTNLDDYYGGWATPGIFFGSSASLTEQYDTIEAVLDDYSFNETCTFESRNEYEDELYTGGYDIWSGCDGEDSLFVNMVVTEKDVSINLILIQLVVATDADVDAFDQITSTFYVVND